MEAQTLQQEVPVYHVCQECNGHGCVSCSDLLILDGDIQLDPDWSDELPDLSPINGVIGVIPCRHCGKTDFDNASGCYAPQVSSPSVGDWVCTVAPLLSLPDVHCPACSHVGPSLSFDIINYDSDVDYLICPVCCEEFLK
ncbi:hypothetical protein [Aeromonas sp. 603696]|uniref:hypothetical protein n=1 Tax=Aeromonas sp. 603696 TaxID=2712049 RepID=UPI003B9E3D07